MKSFIRYAMLSTLCVGLSYKPPIQAQDGPRVIQIHARRFSFTPSEIELIKGEPVTLEFIAEDTNHGLKIPELGIDTESGKGKVTRVEVTPQQAGTFEGRCSHFCGVGHGSMVLSVTVKEK